MRRLTLLIGLLVVTAACGRSCGFGKTDLIWVEQGGKYGYIDAKGTVAINPQFDEATDFADGLAAVRLGAKWGFVDDDGKYVVNPQFDDAMPFADGLAAVRMGDQWGYVGPEGKFVINPQFDHAYPFAEDRARVVSGGKFAFIDKAGKYIANPQFDQALDFSDGLACVRIGANWGYVDLKGNTVINPQYEGALPFSEGLAAVSVAGQVGFIDTSGRLVVNPQFSAAGSFSEGLAPAANADMKFGFIKKDGSFAVNPQFERVRGFAEGRALVELSGKIGYADTSGNLAITPQFQDGGPFSGGRASVRMNGRYGYIDKAGKLIINPQFDRASRLTAHETAPLFGARGLGLGATDRGRVPEGRDALRFRLAVPSMMFVTVDASAGACNSLRVEGVSQGDGSGRCSVSGVFRPGSYPVVLTASEGSPYVLSVSSGTELVPVSVGASLEGDTRGGAKLYALEVAARATLHLSLDPLDGGDPVLEVLDEHGRQLAANDDGGMGSGSLIRANFEPGRYLVRARAYNQRGGRVRLSVMEGGSQTQPWGNQTQPW